MRRSGPLVVAAAVLVACGGSSAASNAELCQDLTNLQATVAFLATPPPTATVGDIRGALDKLDATWEAVHDHPDVPDAEDDALYAARQDYRDAIEGVGDDDSFAPFVVTTAGIGQGLVRSYDAVRVRLVCPASLEPG